MQEFHCGREMLGECFAELFVKEREFNLPILETRDELQLLPPAEIHFCDFPSKKLRMVNYRAKWDSDSFEYKHARQVLDFALEAYPLLARLQTTVEQCRHLFGCGAMLEKVLAWTGTAAHGYPRSMPIRVFLPTPGSWLLQRKQV
jgi:hypothetical protein